MASVTSLQTPLTRDQAAILGYTARVTNSMSIVVCVAMVGIYLAIHHFDRPLSNRVIFRLAFYVCLVDMGYAIAQLVQNGFVAPSPVCTGSAFTLVFFNLLSAFLRVLVALHLQLVFIHQKTNARIYERYYLFFAVALATGCALAPFFGNMYGWLPTQWFCWYRDDGSIQSLLWQWLSYYLWLSIAVVYCLTAVILVIRKIAQIESEVESVIHRPTASTPMAQLAMSPSQVALHAYTVSASATPVLASPPAGPAPTPRPHLEAPLAAPRGQMHITVPVASKPHPPTGRSYSEGNLAERSQPLARQCLKRVIWYPVIPIITQLMVVINAFVNYFHQDINLPIYVIATALTGLQGFLTGIVFLFDPSVRKARLQLCHYLVERYYYQYHLVHLGTYQPVCQCSGSTTILPSGGPSTHLRHGSHPSLGWHPKAPSMANLGTFPARRPSLLNPDGPIAMPLEANTSSKGTCWTRRESQVAIPETWHASNTVSAHSSVTNALDHDSSTSTSRRSCTHLLPTAHLSQSAPMAWSHLSVFGGNSALPSYPLNSSSLPDLLSKTVGGLPSMASNSISPSAGIPKTALPNHAAPAPCLAIPQGLHPVSSIYEPSLVLDLASDQHVDSFALLPHQISPFLYPRLARIIHWGVDQLLVTEQHRAQLSRRIHQLHRKMSLL
ncbi:hypothetical protein H4R34_004724 [Dimargaris verticillata]|uniref:G-protein coupled receptors family 2 profile 2 domain-containing protein n=1 Tax=Dimargaris verticillata TaxID=2761393 RepID=A0A9W8AYC7_9FUNG|nr:hypothetical protein H4R34_004724 [Dimargaris verticillata]